MSKTAAFLAVLVLSIIPRQACACAPASVITRYAEVADGELVPTNAVIRVVYYSERITIDMNTDVRVERADGSIVAGSWTEGSPNWHEFHPDVLDPTSEYFVADRFAPECFAFGGSSCSVGSWTRWLSFLTLESVDSTPPSFEGPTTGQCVLHQCPGDDGCCGATAENYWTVDFDFVSPESNTRIEATIEGAQGEPETVVTTGVIYLADTGGLGGGLSKPLPDGDYSVTFAAYDIAGNSSMNGSALWIRWRDDVCSVLGGPPMPDAGGGDKVPADGTAAGCGCRNARSSSSLPSLLVLVLIVAFRGRRTKVFSGTDDCAVRPG